MAHRYSLAAAVALGALLLTGCTSEPVDSKPSESSQPATNLSASRSPAEPLESTEPRLPSRSPRPVNMTRCSDVRLPAKGLGEADFNVDRRRQLLTINFSDVRAGRYRNVSYTVRYEADPSCRTNPQMADVVARALPNHSSPPDEANQGTARSGRRYSLDLADNLRIGEAQSVKKFIRFAMNPSARTASEVPFAETGVVITLAQDKRVLAGSDLSRAHRWSLSDEGGTTSALFVLSNSVRTARLDGQEPPTFLATAQRPPICALTDTSHPETKERAFIYTTAFKKPCASGFRVALDQSPDGVIEAVRLTVRGP
jgi:hypothetical protein